MRISCWIPKAADTHTHYLILFVFCTATMVTRTRVNITSYVHCRSCVFFIARINSDCFVVMFTFTFLTVILQEWYHEHSQGLLHCHQYSESVSETSSFSPKAKLILSNDRPKCNRHQHKWKARNINPVHLKI